VSVGGLIILTNARTLALEARLPSEARLMLYVMIASSRAALLVAALARHRREEVDGWHDLDADGDGELVGAGR